MENVVEYHKPIMTDEVISYIKPGERNIIVDCTLGGGGHSSLMLMGMQPGGKLFGIDRDGDAIEAATKRLETTGRIGQFKAIRGNFFDIKELLADEGISGVDAILADLGVSSHQFDTQDRGFSHRMDARLDMRMDQSKPFSAYNVVNEYSEQQLRNILFEYGEEKFAPRIAKAIVERRGTKPIETTFELVDIIKFVLPMKVLREKGHPASRTFQALRIEVNGELDGLEKAISDCVDMLNPGGVIAVITFHSLEDRIVKNVFKRLCDPCTCDKKAPICTCNLKPVIEQVTRKPIVAGEKELEENPRSRSAKLRVARKL